MSEPLNRAGRHVLGTELLHKSKPEPVRRMEVFLGRADAACGLPSRRLRFSQRAMRTARRFRLSRGDTG
jgi:hypothetical protein